MLTVRRFMANAKKSANYTIKNPLMFYGEDFQSQTLSYS